MTESQAERLITLVRYGLYFFAALTGAIIGDVWFG